MSLVLSRKTLSGALWSKPAIKSSGVILEVATEIIPDSVGPAHHFTVVSFCQTDENRFCVGDSLGNVYHFSLQLNRYTLVARLPTSVTSIGFVASPGFVMCAAGMIVHVVQIDSARPVAKLRGPHQSKITKVISPPALGRPVAACLSGDAISIWHPMEPTCQISRRVHATDIALDDHTLYFIHSSGAVRTISTSSFKDQESIQLQGHTLTSIGITDLFVIIGTISNTVLLIRPKTLQPLWAVSIRAKGGCLGVDIVNGNLFATLHSDGIVALTHASCTEKDEEKPTLAIGLSLELRLSATQQPVAFATSHDRFACLMSHLKFQIFHLPSAKLAFDKFMVAEIQKNRDTILPFVALGSSNPQDKTLQITEQHEVPKPVLVPPTENAGKQWVKVNLIESCEKPGHLHNTIVSAGDAVKVISPASNSTKKKSGPQATSQVSQLEEPSVVIRTLDHESRTINMEKLRSTLMRFGVFPERYRPLIWRFLLQLPDKNVSAPYYAVLCNRNTHPGVASLMQPFPLPSTRVKHLLERSLSCLAHHLPVFAVGHYVPAIVFPFVNVFGVDIQSTVEVVLSFMINWGKEFFAYYPHMPVDVSSLIAHLLKAEDPALFQHFSDLGADPETFVWEPLSAAYTEVVSKNEWLQLMDHAFANYPLWLFLWHVRWLCQIRQPLLACKDHQSLVNAMHRAIPFDMNLVVQQTYRLQGRCIQNELTAPYEHLVLFPVDGYPTKLEVHESVIVSKLQEIEQLEAHEEQLRNVNQRARALERRALDNAMLEDAAVGKQRAAVVAKFDATKALWEQRVLLEREKARLRDIEHETRIQAVQEQLRTARRLEDLQSELSAAAAAADHAALDHQQETDKWAFVDKMANLEVQRLEENAKASLSATVAGNRPISNPRPLDDPPIVTVPSCAHQTPHPPAAPQSQTPDRSNGGLNPIPASILVDTPESTRQTSRIASSSRQNSKTPTTSTSAETHTPSEKQLQQLHREIHERVEKARAAHRSVMSGLKSNPIPLGENATTTTSTTEMPRSQQRLVAALVDDDESVSAQRDDYEEETSSEDNTSSITHALTRPQNAVIFDFRRRN